MTKVPATPIFSLTWLLRETLKVLFIVKGRHNITQLSVTRYREHLEIAKISLVCFMRHDIDFNKSAVLHFDVSGETKCPVMLGTALTVFK